MAKKRAEKQKKEQESPKFSPKILYAGIAIVVAVLLWLAFRGMDKTVAVVNGEPLTEKDLEAFKSRIPTQYREQVTPAQVLEQAINEKLLLQEAAAQSVVVTEDEVRQKLKESLLQAGVGEDKLQETLAAQGLTMDDLIIIFQRQLTVTRLLEKAGSVDVTDEQAMEFYTANKQMFGNATFTEVKPELKKALSAQLQQQMLQQYIEVLRSKATIEMKA